MTGLALAMLLYVVISGFGNQPGALWAWLKFPLLLAALSTVLFYAEALRAARQLKFLLRADSEKRRLPVVGH